MLSYNFFLRPPLIKNNTSDYKDARLNLFLQEQLRNYDIIAFQEVFEYGSSRQDRLVEAAQRDGFAYSAKSPKKCARAQPQFCNEADRHPRTGRFCRARSTVAC